MVKWCRPWTNLKRWNRFSFSLSRGAPSAQSEQYSNRENPLMSCLRLSSQLNLFLLNRQCPLNIFTSSVGSSGVSKSEKLIDFSEDDLKKLQIRRRSFEGIWKSSKRRQSLPVNVLPDSFNLKNGMPAIDEHSQRERDPFLI